MQARQTFAAAGIRCPRCCAFPVESPHSSYRV